jgi:hypothetical protein
LAFGVCAVEFSDRGSRVRDVRVDDVGGAVGAAGSVVHELDAVDGSDALEEILGRRSAGWSVGAV